jgi:hypothetical protein
MTDIGTQILPSDVDASLPPGVHPHDRGGADWTPPLGDEQGQSWKPAAVKPFDIPNSHAIAVWQRATTDWATTAFTLNSANGTIAIAGRLVGRLSITLWVPASASHGIQFSEDRGTIDQGLGTPLNPGDSISIPSEGPVYAGCQAGQTAGTIYILDLFNVAAPVPE